MLEDGPYVMLAGIAAHVAEMVASSRFAMVCDCSCTSLGPQPGHPPLLHALT
jgi:hypothetical protein